MKILTEQTGNPTPIRSWDWMAWLEGKEEGLVGFGSTQQGAVDELLTMMEE